MFTTRHPSRDKWTRSGITWVNKIFIFTELFFSVEDEFREKRLASGSKADSDEEETRES